MSPEEETHYLEKGPQLGQKEAIRAIRTLGNALEHMARGSDQRIELELALFSLSEPPQMMQRAAVEAAPRPAAPQETSRPFAAAAPPQPFVSVPVAPGSSRCGVRRTGNTDRAGDGRACLHGRPGTAAGTFGQSGPR